MGIDMAYGPSKLEEVLNRTRKHYPAVIEFIGWDHSEKIRQIMDALAFLNEGELFKYAFTLRESELAYVLLALADCTDELLCRMLETILVLRFRKKLYELNWIMLQMDFHNRNLLKAMGKMVDGLKGKYPRDYAVSLFARLDAMNEGNTGQALKDNLAEYMYRLLVAENTDISSFCRKYALYWDSALAKRISEHYFINAGRDGFLKNKEAFKMLLDSKDAINPLPLMSCYLERLDVREYFDDINEWIEKRYGGPGFSEENEKKGLWEALPKACADKFQRWQNLKVLASHFGGKGNKPFTLWASYIDRIKKVVRDECRGLLFMDFGTFIAVDSMSGYDEASTGDLEEGSTEFLTLDKTENKKNVYIVERKYFDLAYESEESERVETISRHWRIIAEHVVDVRDLILEDVESEVYRAGYHQVQLLYLKEILKEKLESSKKSPVEAYQA